MDALPELFNIPNWECPDSLKAPLWGAVKEWPLHVSNSVAGKWELLFLVLQAFGCLIGMPILSHIPKTGYKFLVLSNLKINPCSKAIWGGVWDQSFFFLGL